MACTGGGGAGGGHGPRAQALEGAPDQLVGANFKKKIRPRQISKVTLHCPGLTVVTLRCRPGPL